jgi:tetratricopeptide (TPR) repeat protein
LEGSILRSGQQLRINAQFIRVRDDFPVWSGKYDREATDIFAIQEEISRGIVNSLRLKLGRGRRRYEMSTDAYDLYLRARALEMQPRLSGLEKSVGPFDQTIAKDTSFAPAYAGLAFAYAGLSGFDRFTEAERADQMSKMRAAAEKALQLDPLLAEAHVALGTVYAREAQWDQSRASFLRAIELDPGNSFLRSQFVGNLLLPLNRIAEALAQTRLAVISDPLSPDIQRQLTQVLCSAGRFQEAARHCGPECAEVLFAQGRADEVIRILQGQPASAVLGRAYALTGRREDAERIAAVQRRPIGQAAIFTALGDKDRAFEALDRAIPLGPVRLGRDLSYAEFAPLHGDPRLKALRKKVGLPD